MYSNLETEMACIYKQVSWLTKKKKEKKKEMAPCKEEYTQWKFENTESNSEFIVKLSKQILSTLWKVCDFQNLGY